MSSIVVWCEQVRADPAVLGACWLQVRFCCHSGADSHGQCYASRVNQKLAVQCACLWLDTHCLCALWKLSACTPSCCCSTALCPSLCTFLLFLPGYSVLASTITVIAGGRGGLKHPIAASPMIVDPLGIPGYSGGWL